LIWLIHSSCNLNFNDPVAEVFMQSLLIDSIDQFFLCCIFNSSSKSIPFMFRFSCKVIVFSQVHREGNNSISSFCFISLSFQVVSIWTLLRAAFDLEAGPIRCVRGLKSSLVVGQKVEIGPNPFTPRGRADLVVWMFMIKNVCYDTV